MDRRRRRPDEVDAGTAAAAGLSEADLQVIGLFADGLPVEAIARRLDMSERTVRRRARAVCDRLGVGTMMQAVAWAARRGLI